jgi:hypothetical protein
MDAPEQERIHEEIRRQIAFLDEYNAYIATNLRRADDLIRFAENYFEKGRPSQIKDDILRAAVVFLHATLEDFLRYIGSSKDPDKKVDQLIINKRTFGNTNRISQLLESAGIPTNEVSMHYPSLNELMARRHEIVHKGDLKPTADLKCERDPVPIEASKVTDWYNTIISFTSTVAVHKL